jgi:hypothetical protein
MDACSWQGDECHGKVLVDLKQLVAHDGEVLDGWKRNHGEELSDRVEDEYVAAVAVGRRRQPVQEVEEEEINVYMMMAQRFFGRAGQLAYENKKMF